MSTFYAVRTHGHISPPGQLGKAILLKAQEETRFGEHAVLCPEACLGHVGAICIRGPIIFLLDSTVTEDLGEAPPRQAPWRQGAAR